MRIQRRNQVMRWTLCQPIVNGCQPVRGFLMGKMMLRCLEALLA